MTPRRKALRIAVGVAVTAALAALILLAVPFGEVADAFGDLDPVWLAPLLGSYAASFLFRAARYRSLGVRLERAPLLAVTSVHLFLNRVMPFRTGELALPVLAQRLAGTPLVAGLSVIALGHLLDLAAVALTFLAALLVLPSAREAIGLLGTVLVGVTAALTVAGYLLLPVLGGRLAAALAKRLAGRRARWAEKLRAAAGTLAEVGTVSRGALLAASIWTALQWLTTFGVFWAALCAMGVDPGPARIVLGSTAAILAGILPIGGVGSFGTLEAGWAAGFVLVGVERGPALASGLVASGATFAFSALAAAAAALWLRSRRSRSSDPP